MWCKTKQEEDSRSNNLRVWSHYGVHKRAGSGSSFVGERFATSSPATKLGLEDKWSPRPSNWTHRIRLIAVKRKGASDTRRPSPLRTRFLTLGRFFYSIDVLVDFLHGRMQLAQDFVFLPRELFEALRLVLQFLEHGVLTL